MQSWEFWRRQGNGYVYIGTLPFSNKSQALTYAIGLYESYAAGIRYRVAGDSEWYSYP